MGFRPLVRMWERVETGRSDSDTTLFHDLMYLGEMVIKTAAAALVAGVEDDADRSRYRLVYQLVRADGIGEWARVLAELLTGPASRHLQSEAREEQRDLTQKFGEDAWQHQSVTQLHACLALVGASADALPAKLDGLRWMTDFAQLRNKTRGHGAPKTAILHNLCPILESSIRAFTENYIGFRREWAFLHRNLSGKYRITKLTSSAVRFDGLKQAQATTFNYPDGVYVYLGRPTRVELVRSDVDASDFFLANGGFNEKRFEYLSYATGETSSADATVYLGPTTPLPDSETQGIGELQILSDVFANIPPAPQDYVRRELLEEQLVHVLTSDRHPVITLVGRGGIGKTSLALTVLHKIAKTQRYNVLLWFSARDLDLLPEGPKPVRPGVLTTADIANEYVRLLSPDAKSKKGFKSQEFLASCLTRAPEGPTLFIFDNFETVTNPTEVFTWLDTYIRPPNKILVTTRHRDFKGDYPIDVRGMSESEFDVLVDATASRLGISGLLTHTYRQELYRESEGHPYVVRILLGEVAKANRLRKVERIVADADDLLTALFERTYANLTPVAQRVFLTLSNWRTTIPQLAVEAVLLRSANERMAVRDAVDELERSSFIELLESEADKTMFINTPLVAALFGRKKLAVSPMSSAVEADTELLRQFGAGQRTDVRHGLAPRIERLVRTIAKQMQDPATLQEHIPMLEFLARQYPPTWLMVSSLYEEDGSSTALEAAKRAVRSHLETATGAASVDSWYRLAELCRRTGDVLGEAHALVELSQQPDLAFEELSSVANRINTLMAENKHALDSEDKSILIRRLASAMEPGLDRADATACSRLAWLYMHLRDSVRATELVKMGLNMEPDNEHCQKLQERLSRNRW